MLRTLHGTTRARDLALGLVASTLLACAAAGCVYPRRSTALSPVTSGNTASVSAPADLYTLTIVDAQVTPRKRGDLAWDEGEGAPDPFVRVYRGDLLLFETPPLEDTYTPEWSATLPQNVQITSDAMLRLEVWDRDTIGSDPIGQVRTRGLPQNAVLDAAARLLLENGSWLTIRVTAPRAHRGVGLAEYEVRPDALVATRVLAHSPAARAGIVVGDAVVAIGDRRVSAMSDGEAASALSMASQRETRLLVRGREGRERTVELDRGFVWLTM